MVLKKILESSDTLTTTYIENTLVKSFIYDNTAITFTVQGNTYREAGKFIRIKSKEAINTNTVKGKATRDIDGYWFILNVKHIFKGDFYTNEYVCVKLHSDAADKKSTQQIIDLMAPNEARPSLINTSNLAINPNEGGLNPGSTPAFTPPN